MSKSNDPTVDFIARLSEEVDIERAMEHCRGLFLDWARYERAFTEHISKAIASPQPTEYVKYSARAGHFKQLADQAARLLGVVFTEKVIATGLLWAMQQIERQDQKAQELNSADE